MKANNPIATLPPGSAAAQGATPVADSLLPPPRLLPGERPSAYEALRIQILGDIQPKGSLETILVRDVVDLQWEVLRHRRLKAALLRAKAYEGLQEILAPFGEEYDIDAMANKWACGDSDARQLVKRLMKSAGLTDDEIIAATLGLNLDKVERIDGLTTSAEKRRNNALGEIDRRRQGLGAAVRTAVLQVEDAEFKEVGGERPAEAVQ